MAQPGLSIVYLVLEDFRGLSMSALCGNGGKSSASRPCAATPHLDGLVRDGVLFEHAYAQSPICNPSRTSTMTGRYPSVTGVLHNDAGTGRPLPNLPQLLQREKRGRIVTASPYSKVFHLPPANVPPSQQPWDRGWWNASNWRAVPPAVLPWLGRTAPVPKRVSRGPGYGHVKEDIYHHMAFKRTMAMLGALLAQPRPFFFSAGISGTHTPLMPPLSFVRRHMPTPSVGAAAAETALPLAARHAAHAPSLARKDGFQSHILSATQEREYMATYLAAAEYVDAQVGAVLALLKRSEGGPSGVSGDSQRGGSRRRLHNAGGGSTRVARRLQETLDTSAPAKDGGGKGGSGKGGGGGGGGGGGSNGGVLRGRQVAVVVHADHGFHLGEHGRWSKYTLYEEAVRVPLVFRVPGGQRNVRRPQLVELVDVLPTLLDLWGVAPAQRPHLDGKSLLPLLGLKASVTGGTGAGAVFLLRDPGDGAASYPARGLVRSAMRHPMRLDEGGGAGGGRWVCGEQHYVRSPTASFTAYLHAGRVVNSSLFDLTSDPLEQRNLLLQPQAEWPYSTLRNWARLVAAEQDMWPRDAVHARDVRGAESGEACSELNRRQALRSRRRLTKKHILLLRAARR